MASQLPKDGLPEAMEEREGGRRRGRGNGRGRGRGRDRGRGRGGGRGRGRDDSLDAHSQSGNPDDSRKRDTDGSTAGGEIPEVDFAQMSDTDDDTSHVSRVQIAELPTAEMMFPAGEKSSLGDYHKNMNADMFMLWLKRRLIPTFKVLYPGKKMILILDNAAYHHGMSDGWKSPLQATKAENLRTLRQLEQRQIRVPRDGVMLNFEVPCDGQSFKVYPNGPSAEELRHATCTILKEKSPESLMTRAERFFLEEKIGLLLFTPPYCPALQPIELFWAHGKKFVASKFEPKRRMLKAWQELRCGFYGKDSHRAASCRKLERHSLEEANKCIERDEVLEGTIDNLRNVPDNYKVSKNCGLLREEDSEGEGHESTSEDEIEIV